MVKWSYPPFAKEETNVCIRVCKLNMLQTHCIGCKRSLLEIEQWRDYTSERKKELILELDNRIITD